MENGNGQDGDSHGFRGGSKEGCVGLCIQLTFLSASQGQTGVCGRGGGVQLCVWQTGPLPLGEEIDKRREHGHSILEVEERKRGLEIRWSGK